MSLSINRNPIVCLKCQTPCCEYVKHMPYLGETTLECFGTFLIGAFPPYNPKKFVTNNVFHRFIVTEWIVPAELSKCIAYSSNKLCNIYETRPFSCQNFPLISKDKLHEFCPYKENFLHNKFLDSSFDEEFLRLDLSLSKVFCSKGEEGLKDFIFEDKPLTPPLLYNNYLALVLIFSGVDIRRAFKRQMALLRFLKGKGLENITVIIPGTEYCLSGATEGLMANLEYLIYKIEHERLIQQLRTVTQSLLDT